MPTTRRFDLALKYSQPENARRLADAVMLWEISAHWVTDREATLEQIKKVLGMNDKDDPKHLVSIFYKACERWFMARYNLCNN